MNSKFFGKGSVEIATESGSPVRRLAITADNLVTQPFAGIDIIPDVIDYAARTHGTRDAVGWRDIVDIHEEEKEVKKMVGGKEVTEKKTWKYFQLSDYKYLSFVDVQERVSALARGLLHHGITKDDVFNIYAQTRCV
jgi:long-chain acyl-CoA synthetase